MRNILKLKRCYILCLIPISLIIVFISRMNSTFAEKIFALGVYRVLSQILSLITGLIPISIAEIIIYSLPIFLIALPILFVRRLINQKGRRGEVAWKALLNVLCTVTLLLFLFIIFGGVNYYRYSFRYYSDLEIRDSTVEELYSLTESLMIQANELREQTTGRDEDGVFALTGGYHTMASEAKKAMDLLGQEYPVLGGMYAKPKPVLTSKLMSYTEITGIFMPFTMEANVNIDIPDYSIPATMLHELAHLRGFMREDEANYIAYLAGMKSNNPEFRYSATMMALIISGNALYSQDVQRYFEIREQFSEGVIRDIRNHSAYWAKYEDTVVSTVSDRVNDTYLKANLQSDGVKSYGRMLDLLLAKYRKDRETHEKRE